MTSGAQRGFACIPHLGRSEITDVGGLMSVLIWMIWGGSYKHGSRLGPGWGEHYAQILGGCLVLQNILCQGMLDLYRSCNPVHARSVSGFAVAFRVSHPRSSSADGGGCAEGL